MDVHRLLENHAILMLDRHIFHFTVSLPVTHTVMLNLDNYAADFTVWQVEHVFHNRCVFSASSDITD